MKKSFKKLALRKDVIANLGNQDLQSVAGGGTSPCVALTQQAACASIRPCFPTNGICLQSQVFACITSTAQHTHDC